MKAFRQIDLRHEKKYIWTSAVLLSLLGILFTLYPIQAYSAGTHHVVMKPPTPSFSADLIFSSLMKVPSEELPADVGLLNGKDSLLAEFVSPENNQSRKQSRLIKALPFLFSRELRHHFRWVWYPADSSVCPAIKNPQCCYGDTSIPILSQ